jgi:hypothetical protein
MYHYVDSDYYFCSRCKHGCIAEECKKCEEEYERTRK